MKSIKPGRAPSFMGGVAGIFMALFGVFWTINAFIISGSFLFSMFGVIFTIFVIIQVVHNFKNATSENSSSMVDITDNNEEPDSLNEIFANKSSDSGIKKVNSRFCDYCGETLNSNDKFCPSCRKKAQKINSL